MSFFSGLCWELEESSSRRVGFPSWSWTGWKDSVVKWAIKKEDWGDIVVDDDVQVVVQLSDGLLIDLEKATNYRTIPSQHYA